jgi:hypothetical protein
LLRGVVDQPAHLLGIQPGGAPGGGGGAEVPADAVRALVRLKNARTQGHQETRSHVVAQRYGAQELCAADAELFARR